MVGRGNLVAQGYEHTAAAWELLFQFPEISLVGIAVYLIAGIHGLERDMPQAACHLPFVLVTENETAVFHELVKGVLCVCTFISPQVLAVVDVAGDLYTHAVGKAHGLHSSVKSILADGACYARAVKERRTGKDVAPLYISVTQRTER